MRGRMRPLLLATMRVAAIVLVGAVAVGYWSTTLRLPEGTHGLTPPRIAVNTPNGQVLTTNFHALVVVDGAPNMVTIAASPQLRSLLNQPLQQAYPSGAGDSKQESARLAAWAAARHAIGLPARSGVMLAGPAPAPLREGDVVTEVDGKPADPAIVSSAIRRGGVHVTVRREGATLELLLPGAWRVSTELSFTSVGLDAVPVDVPIMDGVSGSSDGLALALAYIDALTPGDLTAGRRIAVTGTVAPSGSMADDRVGAIGAVAFKTEAAIEDGMDVLFVPVGNAEAARRTARGMGSGITIVPVHTLQQALMWLCATGGTSSACAHVGPAADMSWGSTTQ